MDARSLRVLNRETRRNELFQRKAYVFQFIHRNSLETINTTLESYNPDNNSNVKNSKNLYNLCDSSNTIINYESVKPAAVYLRYANIVAVDLSGSSVALSPSPADPTELNDMSEATLPPLESINAVSEDTVISEKASNVPEVAITPPSDVKIPSVKVPMQCCTIS